MDQKEKKEKKEHPMTFPTVGKVTGSAPIVVIGPNGVGKSRLMRTLAGTHNRFVSSQRRTYLEDQIPSTSAENAKSQVNSQLSNAYAQPWQYSSEIDYLFGRMLQEHFEALDTNNEAAQTGDSSAKPFIDDTLLANLQGFWQSVFHDRKISFRAFHPTVKRVDPSGQVPDVTYVARTMSDGERTCLYMAARVLTADPGILVIDEPELHMHRKLAIDYWNKLEEMRPDIRFVYVTHELHFALSRRDPTLIVVRDEGKVEKASIEKFPPNLAEALLGAATLTINAQRIVFFEGISGHGLAHDLFKRWITGTRSAALGMGGRNAVLDAGMAFSQSGIVANAEVIAVVDRDHGPEDWLNSLKPPAFVLGVHEIESLFALPDVIRAVAEHIAYSKGDPWPVFLARARKSLEAAMSKAVAERVRARIDMLIGGVFAPEQIKTSLADTQAAHTAALTSVNWASENPKLFGQEETRIWEAMKKDDSSILVVMSGKQAVADAAVTLNMGLAAYANIVLNAIEDSKHKLHKTIVAALAKYLPARE